MLECRLSIPHFSGSHCIRMLIWMGPFPLLTVSKNHFFFYSKHCWKWNMSFLWQTLLEMKHEYPIPNIAGNETWVSYSKHCWKWNMSILFQTLLEMKHEYPIPNIAVNETWVFYSKHCWKWNMSILFQTLLEMKHEFYIPNIAGNGTWVFNWDNQNSETTINMGL